MKEWYHIIGHSFSLLTPDAVEIMVNGIQTLIHAYTSSGSRFLNNNN